MDVLNKERADMLNKVSQAQIDSYNVATQNAKLASRQTQLQIDRQQKEQQDALKVDEWYQSFGFDPSDTETSMSVIQAMTASLPPDVSPNNPYLRKTLQQARKDALQFLDDKRTSDAEDLVFGLQEKAMSLFTGTAVDMEQATGLMNELSAALTNPFIFNTPASAQAVSRLSTMVANQIQSEQRAQGETNDQIIQLASNINTTARQLVAAMEAGDRDEDLIGQLRSQMTRLISLRNSLMGDVPDDDPGTEPPPGEAEPKVFNTRPRRTGRGNNRRKPSESLGIFFDLNGEASLRVQPEQ